MNGTTPSPTIIGPDITSYFPCSCTPDLSIDDNDPHITLICDKLNLTDSKMSDILDAFLTTPNVSKILRLALPGNNLTRVPDQIRLFTRLIYVDLEDNHIQTIHSGAFVSHLDQHYVFLDNNKISHLEPDAFQGFSFEFVFIFIS